MIFNGKVREDNAYWGSKDDWREDNIIFRLTISIFFCTFAHLKRCVHLSKVYRIYLIGLCNFKTFKYEHAHCPCSLLSDQQCGKYRLCSLKSI